MAEPTIVGEALELVQAALEEARCKAGGRRPHGGVQAGQCLAGRQWTRRAQWQLAVSMAMATQCHATMTLTPR